MTSDSTDARTLVTGFLAFGTFATNPSAELARGSGEAFELIEVAYAAADAFVDSFAASRFDRVVLMGVAGSSTTFRLERQARNAIGLTPDVRGHVPSRRHIEDPPDAPALPTTLWRAAHVGLAPHLAFSDDAGDYLCNYLYHRMLRRWPSKQIGFLHVPPTTAIDLPTQRTLLARLLHGLSDQRG